jgi:hypothetical protein
VLLEEVDVVVLELVVFVGADVLVFDDVLLDVPPVSSVGVELVVEEVDCVPVGCVRLVSRAVELPAALDVIGVRCVNALMKLMIVKTSIDETEESIFTSSMSELAVGV